MGLSKMLRLRRVEVRGRVRAEEIFPTDSVCRCLSAHDSVQLIKLKTSIKGVTVATNKQPRRLSHGELRRKQRDGQGSDSKLRRHA